MAGTWGLTDKNPDAAAATRNSYVQKAPSMHKYER
jgi:hypothetical protein